MLASQNVITYRDSPSSYEYILVTSGKVLYICLGRTSETDDPFISAIELRRLQNGMYEQAKPGTILVSQSRSDVGGYSIVRYPQDKFDRIWTPSNSYSNLRNLSSKEPVITNNTEDFPPVAVMQTAWVTSTESYTFELRSLEGSIIPGLLVLYFAEIETLNVSESRSFYVAIDGVRQPEAITLVRNYSALEVKFLSDITANKFELVEDTKSTLPPIINGYEHYSLLGTELATYSQDLEVLDALQRRFHMKDWISDPCYLIPWDGIGCDSSYSTFRIFKIDLSGRNLTGSVPNDIAQLTALVNVSLDNNHFTGLIPDFTKLINLERLYLHNNNLSGTVEWLSKLKTLKELYLQNNNLCGTLEWLSKLINLKELNIENNNFSGVIPVQLLINCSSKYIYSGNPYLRMSNSECILQNSNNSNKNKLKVVVGITLGGILIIALALIVSTVVYRKKSCRKEEPKPSLYQDYSMITVPNPTKSRAFTLDEMIAATKSFNREIGRGGFGSVFFGKLPEGKVIAVKVLSMFSRQGVREFLNEVDLLSKINHRNLVSLLGYSNETREVMLIYEYMSGGSLRDHLHGPGAEKIDLNWKRRLKIVLDAAQGLEYLHVGCTPKIIHRDVKTANILLDRNLNGKLADFGLSRMTIDGEATHVTTAVKGTFGYLDPEYFNTQMLTEKSDVYSFGVVLLEIICGRQPIDLSLPEEELNIVRWVTPYLLEVDENAGKISEIIDERLCGDYDMKSITSVFKIAMRCVEPLPSSRPSVSEVVAELIEAMKQEDNDYISSAEEIGIQNGDLMAGRAEQRNVVE